MSGTHEYDAPPGSMNDSTFFPPSWQGLRQQIVYLAQFGNSIQVIHAEAGGGKSTFFTHLLQTGLGSTTIGVTVAEGAGLAAFFRDVLEELGLRPAATAGLGELAAALRGFVQTLHKERARAVLLVDDAHHLTDSELGALVSTLQGQADPGVGFHVVLFATPGLAARIDALQVLDVAVHDAALPAFSASELQQLLQMRQRPAGNLATVQSIWYQSGGLPGVALSIFDDLRPSSPPAGRIMSLRGLPMGHIAALVVLCGVLVWAFLVRKSDEAPHDETPQVIALPVPQVADPVVPPVASVPEPSVAHVPASQVVTESASPYESTDGSQPPSLSSGQGEAGVNLEKEPDISAPPVATEAERPKEPVRPPDADQRPSPPEPVKATQAPSAAGAARLLSFPPNAYVLQLMAASAEDKLVAFIASQPNKHNLYMYKTERDGKVLHILVEGYYADKSSAQAAVANLPAQQRAGGPWPKKIEQIHQELRKNR